MADVPDFSNLQDIKQRADAFISYVAGQLAAKDSRIAALEAELKKAVEVIDSIIAVRSDFALLKDKTINQAKSVKDEISALLPPQQ